MNTPIIQFKDLSEFLAKHNAKNDKSLPITHTRIGDKESNIFAGAYSIPKESLQVFHSLYYDNVFVKKRKEYLTEKQLEGIGPMAIDFDFRYHYDVETRQHSKEHIQDMILLYLEEIKAYFIFEENKPFDIFIFEKPNVNRLEDKSLTKDGIHMILGIQVDHIIQMMIRDKIVEKLSEIWDLPLINSWESVLDEGISKGTTNWQLFGSRKPGNEAYELSQHFIITYDSSDGEFMMDEKKITEFDLKNNFIKLSVQNESNPKFELNPKIIDSYNKRLESKGHKIKRPASKTKMNLIYENDDEEDSENMLLSDITNKESLKKAVENVLKSLLPSEYDIKELHEYTQILPEKYFQPGSHLLNRQVAFALKHTDERLFLSWIMLRSKASDFDYNSIQGLYNEWCKMKHKKNGITKRSIMYWAKQDAFDDYEKVKHTTIDHFIEETLFTQTEFDKAQVLHKMFSDKYVCSSIKDKTWHTFKNHRWETDKGMTLRLAISKDMFNLYTKKRVDTEAEYQHYDSNDERLEHLKKKVKAISEILINLKKTNDKNNVMREAMELFYDKDFVKNMDTNKFLLCFNNGVIDFATKTFRDGYPQDYISKSTGINYIEYNPENQEMNKIGNEITSFMEKLFPIPELNKYMWEHLASCLVGTNDNQTFNIYHGSGSNGKSILTDLMSHSLGEYKGTVPITLVTEKRNSIGGTSSEIIQLKGIRYAVMQEPSKDTKINEGIMKELTGGDPVQGRALYCESEIFEPQFKLVVCTNSLFDITSNDDGTWRRIRKCDFLSKFIDEGEEHTDDTKFVFLKDKTLKNKLPELAPVFMSMLVKKAFETSGIVKDCPTVMDASNKYRKGQDNIAAFVSERITRTDNPNDVLGKVGIIEDLKLWFSQENLGKKIPKSQEVYDYLDKKFGNYKEKSNKEKCGWRGIKLNDKEDDTNYIEDLQNK
jgi:P4 family phage/plasmid primase-like protien